MISFSRRTEHASDPAALAVALERARARGPVLDLTVSNPTTAGLPYDDDAIVAALADRRALRYAPEARGLLAAREAVAAHHRTSADRVFLTASTSEAYAQLFTLLCDAGDEVLVPAPSYPLFEYLARFEDVRIVPYALGYADGWHVDLDALARARTPRTRAVVTVNPNNPTGSFLDRGELAALRALGVPVISDEVFASYALRPDGEGARVTTALGTGDGLTFALSGLSKLAGLPQMKAAWIVLDGATALVDEASRRLELLGDAYLSASTPTQLALPQLLATRGPLERAILARCRANLSRLEGAIGRGSAASVRRADGGWYAVVRVPDVVSDERWALALLEHAAVYVHAGYFFDFPSGAHLVVSLLTPEPVFAEGAARLAAFVDAPTLA